MLYYFRLWRRRYSRPFNRIFYILIFFIFIGFILSISSVLLLDGDDYDDNIVVKNSPLIFCFVLSSNDRHLTSSRSILYTWGKRCDRFYFVTRLQNTSVELMMLENFENITNITSNTITQHTLNVLSYLEKEALFSSYHWFLRGSDDSFVILPNLRRLINQLNPNYPLAYVGDVEQMYKNYQISASGSVMLFNRHALTRLTSFDDIKDDQLYNEKEQCLENIIYDHELVKCMKQIGININPLNNNLILSQNLSTYRMDKRLKGNCCSPYTVAFRSNNETDMYKFDFFYHRLDALSKINI